MTDPSSLRDLLGDWTDDDLPLYEALAVRLEALFDRGVVPAGVRLPAERQLAGVLNVSRGTVVRAYEWLRERERVHTRHGSGTVVGAPGTPLPSPREAQVAASLPTDSIYHQERRLDEVISLRGACWVGADDLPREAIDRGMRDVERLMVGHGYSPSGLPELRVALARMLTARGVATSPDEVLPTSGAMQAISLVTQLRVGPGDLVATEAVSYPGALDVFRMADAHVVGVRMGDDGVDVGELAALVQRRRPRLVYLVPSHHNPTGTVMPRPARKLLLEALAGTDTVLLEDLVMEDTWLHEAPPPPLAADAPAEVAAQVLTVGSLSKTVWGGLRLGWVRGPAPTIARLARIKTVADLGSSVMGQALGLRLLEHLDEILADRRAGLRERHDALAAAVHASLPDWSWRPPEGGLALWVDLGWGSSVELGPYAARHGVGIAPGTVFSTSGDARHRLRLPYGHRPELLVEGVRRLALAWDDYRSETAGRDPARAPLDAAAVI